MTKPVNGTHDMTEEADRIEDKIKTQVDVLTDDQFLTWGEAAIPQRVRKFLPRYGKWIEYWDRIPMDKLALFQTRYMQTDHQDRLGFQMAILGEVMIAPSLKTPESQRAAIRADGALISMVINDVTSIKDGVEGEQSLGES